MSSSFGHPLIYFLLRPSFSQTIPPGHGGALSSVWSGTPPFSLFCVIVHAAGSFLCSILVSPSVSGRLVCSLVLCAGWPSHVRKARLDPLRHLVGGHPHTTLDELILAELGVGGYARRPSAQDKKQASTSSGRVLLYLLSYWGALDMPLTSPWTALFDLLAAGNGRRCLLRRREERFPSVRSSVSCTTDDWGGRQRLLYLL